MNQILNINDIQIDYDKEPYILINISKSTSSFFSIKHKTIYDMERHIAYNIMKKRGIKKAKIIFWNNKINWIKINDIEQKEPIDVNYLLTYKVQQNCVYSILSRTLKELTFTNNKPINDVYILTNDTVYNLNNDFEKELIRLFQNNVRIHIHIVENNQRNPLDNILYKNICDMNMTQHLFEFTSHNTNNKTNIVFNPLIPKNYVLFGDHVIHKNNISGLIKLLVTMNISEMPLLEFNKVIYDLSKTIYQIVKDENIIITNEIINLITKIFTDKDNIFDILIDNISNIKLGRIQRFHEYRKPKINNSEKAMTCLFDNVKKSISPTSLTFISFPIRINWNNNMIFLIDDKEVNHNLYIRNKVFPNSCFQYQNHNIPILPVITTDLKPETISCIRQWIFSVYNHQKVYCNTEEMITYQFLIDMLCLYVSDIRKDIKQIYIDLAKIILKEKRSDTEITEYEFLLTNKPELVYGGQRAFYNLMKRCKKLNKIKNITVGTLWYAILIVIDDEKLKSFHKKQFQNNLMFDSERCNFDWNNDQDIIDHIRLCVVKKYKLYDFQNMTNITNNMDSVCYLTSKPIKDTGGYGINEHHILDNIYCKPNIVIEKETFKGIKRICPICHTKLSSNMYRFISPIKITNYYQDLINENKLLVNNHEIINVSSITNMKDYELLDIDKLNFYTSSYEFDVPTINNSLYTKSIGITTNDDFNMIVNYRYPFLQKINFDNIIIAGGFCRSILLKQKVKDIDFFFYGLNNDDYVNRLKILLHELTTSVYEHYRELDNELEIKYGENAIKHNIKIMAMFKPQFNVFELICIKDPTNIINDTFNINTLSKYVQFDNDLTKCTEYNEYYDISMIHRFQFILSKFNTKLDVLQRFDLDPSKVCYDGKNVHMTHKSHFAYKYMANIIYEKEYSNMYDSRISKYFSYGFSIVLPLLDIKKIPEPRKHIVLNNLKFNIIKIDKTNIIVEHKSNLEENLKFNARLENQCKNQDRSLYKSHLFNSLVSVCHYIEVNYIDYIFVDKPFNNLNYDNNEFKFKDSVLEINFIDNIISRIYNYNWYGNLRKKYIDTESYSNKLDIFIKAINRLPKNSKIIINKNCNAFKVKKGVAFTGCNSKNFAKLYMEEYPEYISLTQEMNPITGQRQFICRKSIDDIDKTYAYELLLEEKYFKPYLDIEWTFNSDKNMKLYDEKKFLQKLQDDIISVFRDHYKLILKNHEILILSSCTMYKKSYHVIINSKYENKQILFQSNLNKQESSAYSLYYYLIQKSKLYINIIDSRVYTIDREFRMIYAYKSPNDKRQLIPINYSHQKNYEIESYMITSYPDEQYWIRAPMIIDTTEHKQKVPKCILEFLELDVKYKTLSEIICLLSTKLKLKINQKIVINKQIIKVLKLDKSYHKKVIKYSEFKGFVKILYQNEYMYEYYMNEYEEESDSDETPICYTEDEKIVSDTSESDSSETDDSDSDSSDSDDSETDSSETDSSDSDDSDSDRSDSDDSETDDSDSDDSDSSKTDDEGKPKMVKIVSNSSVKSESSKTDDSDSDSSKTDDSDTDDSDSDSSKTDDEGKPKVVKIVSNSSVKSDSSDTDDSESSKTDDEGKPQVVKIVSNSSVKSESSEYDDSDTDDSDSSKTDDEGKPKVVKIVSNSSVKSDSSGTDDSDTDDSETDNEGKPKVVKIVSNSSVKSDSSDTDNSDTDSDDEKVVKIVSKTSVKTDSDGSENNEIEFDDKVKK